LVLFVKRKKLPSSKETANSTLALGQADQSLCLKITAMLIDLSHSPRYVKPFSWPQSRRRLSGNKDQQLSVSNGSRLESTNQW
jgi:hypothetical protein